jgi:hypothetical protein
MPAPKRPQRRQPAAAAAAARKRPTQDTVDAPQLLSVLTALRKGDFDVRMPADGTGVAGKVADALNDVIELTGQMTGELRRLSNVVG